MTLWQPPESSVRQTWSSSQRSVGCKRPDVNGTQGHTLAPTSPGGILETETHETQTDISLVARDGSMRDSALNRASGHSLNNLAIEEDKQYEWRNRSQKDRRKEKVEPCQKLILEVEQRYLNRLIS